MSIWSLVFLSGLNLPAADVALDAVLKLQHFKQTVGSSPTVPATGGYSFQAFVVGKTNDVVTGATVRLPSGTIKTLTNESPFDLRFEEKFNSLNTLDTAYPHGSGFNGATYQMRMQTIHDGPRTNGCSFAGFLILGGYPTTPQILNMPAAQQIDHTRNFTVQWNDLGGNTNDVVQLLVYQNQTNTVYSSPLPFTTNALTGRSTAVTIPGYSLPPGTNLMGQLLVVHVAGAPDTNYAVGVALMGKENTFPMVTRPPPASPVLTLLSRTNRQSQLKLTGETNRVYQIRASDDLLNWQTLLTTNSATGSFFYNDTQATNFTRRLYQGRVGD